MQTKNLKIKIKNLAINQKSVFHSGKKWKRIPPTICRDTGYKEYLSKHTWLPAQYFIYNKAALLSIAAQQFKIALSYSYENLVTVNISETEKSPAKGKLAASFKNPVSHKFVHRNYVKFTKIELGRRYE